MADGKPGRPRKASDISEKTKIARLDTTKDEELIVQMVKFFVDEAESAQVYQDFRDAYYRNWLFYHGHQWLDEDNNELTDRDKARLNRDICFNHIRRLNPLLTDARPTRYIRPDHPDQMAEGMALMFDMGLMPQMQERPKTDDDVAFDLNEIWHDLEERQQEEMKLALSLTNMTVGGLSWRFPFWHKTSEADPGEPRVRSMRDSTGVLVDPESQEPDFSDARYIIVQWTLDADELQRHYGLSDDEMREIMEHAGYNEDSRNNYYGMVSRTFMPSPPQSARELFTKPGIAGRIIRPRITVKQCWFWGQLPAAYDTEGPSKYIDNPFGRIFTIAGDKLLRSPSPNPYWHGMFPGVPFRDNPDPTSPYGFSDLNWLQHDQIALNILINSILLNATLMGNSRMLVEDGALKSQPTNTPAEIIHTRRGMFDRVQFVQGTPIGGAELNLLGAIEAHAAQRMNDAIQGVAPGAQSSGIAISNLQQAALTVIREKARWLEWAYKRQGLIEVSNLQQFGSHRVSEWYQDQHRYDMGEWRNWHDRMRNLEYDIAVESKAELPMNILDRLKLGTQLRMEGAIDELEALEYMKFPMSKRLREDLELKHDAESESLKFQLAQLRAQQQAFDQQMQGPQVPGMGPGMGPAPQGALPPGGPPPIGTEEQTAVPMPAQSQVARQQTMI